MSLFHDEQLIMDFMVNMGEQVNPSGCGPGFRRFESGYSPGCSGSLTVEVRILIGTYTYLIYEQYLFEVD